MSKLIPGEYDCVSRASLNPSRLRRAHQTSCTPADAYFLIAVMHEHAFPGDTEKTPHVKLRKPRVGRQAARGWGGKKPRKDSEGKFIGWRGYVSLPMTPLSATDREPYGKLRIGLVCHEYAHAVEMLKFGSSGHSARFTMILDELLFHTEQYWTTQAKLASEVK